MLTFLRANKIICLWAVHLSCGMIGILLFMVNVTVKSNCSKSHSQLHQIQVKNWPYQDFFPKIPIQNCRKWPHIPSKATVIDRMQPLSGCFDIGQFRFLVSNGRYRPKTAIEWPMFHKHEGDRGKISIYFGKSMQRSLLLKYRLLWNDHRPFSKKFCRLLWHRPLSNLARSNKKLLVGLCESHHWTVSPPQTECN